jgi:hypothetical protein
MEKNFFNDGGPAFPVADYDHQTFNPGTVAECRRLLSGMSLRDHFAAMAMQGLMARIGAHEAHLIAHDAYIVADAMLAARES